MEGCDGKALEGEEVEDAVMRACLESRSEMTSSVVATACPSYQHSRRCPACALRSRVTNNHPHQGRGKPEFHDLTHYDASEGGSQILQDQFIEKCAMCR